RSTWRGASPPFRNLPPGRSASRRTAAGWAPRVRGEYPKIAPAKPALGSGTLPRGRASVGSQITRHCVGWSASSAGSARATDSWGRRGRGPSRPPPIKRRRWALIIALAALRHVIRRACDEHGLGERVVTVMGEREEHAPGALGERDGAAAPGEDHRRRLAPLAPHLHLAPVHPHRQARAQGLERRL